MPKKPQQQVVRSEKLSKLESVQALLDQCLTLRPGPDDINGDTASGWHVRATDGLLNALADVAVAYDDDEELAAWLRTLGLPRCEKAEYQATNGSACARKFVLCMEILRAPATDKSTPRYCPRHLEQWRKDREAIYDRLRQRLQAEAAERRRVWESFGCSQCGQPAGSQCRSASGGKTGSHARRVKDAGEGTLARRSVGSEAPHQGSGLDAFAGSLSC
ncbi:hypothetical protein [Streptomyces sp. NRRL B-24484]|uniref:hypothetical protein n=1 Tax=Streptomyces sp. NRRL B-24484 TaxID=1463833 RepID=UPI0004C24EE7|nr:hypothetical protein [Streptomyces sp. NRRL B-24484]